MAKWFVLLLSLLVVTGCSDYKPDPAPAQVENLNQKITNWKARRDKLKKLLADLERDKPSLLRQLDELAASETGNLADNPKAQVILEELKSMLRQSAVCKKKLEEYEMALFTSESSLRRLERQLTARGAGVSQEELDALESSMSKLEGSLAKEDKPESMGLKADEMLREELKRYQDSKQTADAGGTTTDARDPVQNSNEPSPGGSENESAGSIPRTPGRQPEAAQVSPNSKTEEEKSDSTLSVPVTLAPPYPPSYPGAPTDKLSLQYAVIELAKQAGLSYDWEGSSKNAGQACRRWVSPSIRGVPFNKAMDSLVKPMGLTYLVQDGGIFLQEPSTSDRSPDKAEVEDIDRSVSPGTPKPEKASQRPGDAVGSKIVEGVGWGGFRVGANRTELIKALGPPDPGSTEDWLKWMRRHHVHCVVNGDRGAVELRFDQGFKFPLSTGVKIGSPEKEVLSLYGKPDHVTDKGRAKMLEFTGRGVLFWVQNGKVTQIVVFSNGDSSK